MERRNFLKNILPLAAIPLISDRLFANVLHPASLRPETIEMLAGDIDRVLVLVRMDGGNDGLNTLIPLDQYAALIDPKVRKDLMSIENQILKLKNTTTLGMHPSMSAMRSMYDDDQLSIIQGVGNTANVFSHFHGIDQWETASDSTQTYYSSWIGRYIEKTYRLASTHYPNTCMPDPFVIEVGQNTLLGRGTGSLYSQTLNPEFNGNITELLDFYGDGDLSNNMKEELKFLRQQQSFTNDYGKKIIKAWNDGNNSSVVYPPSSISNNHPNVKPTTLAQQLKIVARLLKGGLKTRIFVVSIGNFDTHVSQVTSNWHSLLLKDLSEAIGAFQKDINQLGLADRVLGMTYSEFGRRVVQNGFGGTEHGLAAPMFVFGSMVKGGIIGNNFKIDDVNLINDKTNVPLQYDYRQVYKSVMQNWFGACENDANDIIKTNVQAVTGIFRNGVVIEPCLMGPLVDPDSVACKGTVSVVDITGDDHHLYAKIFPNPSNGAFSIIPMVGFDSNFPIFINIMDVRGHIIMSEETRVTQGAAIEINRKFQPGMYIIRLQNKKYAINQKVVIHE